MKIASANLQMASSHTRLQSHEVSESLQMWVGQRRPAASNNDLPATPATNDAVTLSPQGKTAQANRSTDGETTNDPKLDLIRSVLEFLTGRHISLLNTSDLGQGAQTTQGSSSPSAGFGVAYDRHETYAEFEQTDFAASGTVNTADGRSISFSVQLSMQRSYYEESNVSLRLGDAAKATDPLVLNFAGTAASLTDQRFAFDLNSDGKDEQINFVGGGSGFLVFDRNGDGKVNNGQELFGPTSGNGFSELAKLDQDRNGWIDENDAAFSQLSVWSKTADGADILQSLREAGVGAIALAHSATPFSLKTDTNELLGQIRSSGVFLQENGQAGTIQQIDLTA